jgi:hypothetical protein
MDNDAVYRHCRQLSDKQSNASGNELEKAAAPTPRVNPARPVQNVHASTSTNVTATFTHP